MANIYTAYRVCTTCFGTGIEMSGQPDGHGGITQQEQPCAACGEVGKVEAFTLGFSEPDVYPTYKIIEATDATEYAALSDANKDAYNMIVSCGTVDLADGTAVRTKLMAMFGAGTTTRANLAELVS